MLQTPKYKVDQVVTFKLTNGDEIVAKIVEEKDTAFIISKPCTVLPSAQGMALLQSLYTSDLNNSLELDRQHVIFHASTVEQVQNHYIATTTGIEPVTAGGIIT